jgi:tetratricopeptide (TPR) repeat protein
MDKEQLIEALNSAISAKNLEKLEELGKQAVENFPKEAFGYSFLSDFFSASETPDYVKAQTCIAKACELAPKNAEYLVRFANLKEEQKLYDDARVLYLKALIIDENNFEALKNMGLYEMRVSKMMDKAKEYLEKAKSVNEKDKLVNLHLAELYYNQKNLEDALISINLAQTKEFNEPATVMLIKILFALGNNKNGLKVYDSLVSKRPDNVGYRYDFAQKLYDSNVYGEAAVQLKKGMDLSDEEIPSTIVDKYIKALTLNGKEAEAISELNKVIKENPDNYLYYNLRVNAHIFAKNFKSAIEDLEKIVRLLKDDNLNFEYREKLAFLNLNEGNTEEARTIFEKMSGNTLHAKVGLYGLGILEFTQENHSLAYHFLRKAKLKGNKDAEKFIYNRLQDYLNGVKDKLIADSQGNVASNAQSSIIKKLSGKLWCFSDLDSKALSSQPENVYKSFVNSFKASSLVITEKGGLFVKSVNAEPMVFKILSEEGNVLKAEFIVLDGTRKYEATITLKGSDEIIFSELEGENLHFKNTKLTEIPLVVLKAYIRTMIPSDMKFMGSGVEKISETFFKPA